MPVTAINILKQWFETGDKPTQLQFYALLDSYRHKNSKISFDDLDEELQSAIAGMGVGLFVSVENVDHIELAAGWYDKFIVDGGDDGAAFNIGTTEGGSELGGGFQIQEGGSVYDYTKKFTETTTVYFTGLTGDFTIKIRRS